MVKIVTGFSGPGGSTMALIRLTNELNLRGYEAKMHGPHKWFLGRCKSALIKDLKLVRDDNLICHYISFPKRPMVAGKVLLACHEKWWFSFSQVQQYWDTCVFLHEAHRQYHSAYKGESVIIPNLKPDLKYKKKNHLDKIAGVIGTIGERKQTHVSILKALGDGCEKVLIFGGVGGDSSYFEREIEPLLSDTVRLAGFAENKQAMYDSIGKVYHFSKGEVASLVKDECYLTGTKFFGNEETENEVSSLTNDEVIGLWVKELGL